LSEKYNREGEKKGKEFRKRKKRRILSLQVTWTTPAKTAKGRGSRG